MITLQLSWPRMLIPPFTGAYLFHGSADHCQGCPVDLLMKLGILLCTRWPCVVVVCLCDRVCVVLNAVHGLDPLQALISPLSLSPPLPSPPARIVKVRSCDFCCDKRRSTASGARQHLLVFHEAQIWLLVLHLSAVITRDQGSLGL